jgi:hypothetical protein
LFQGQIYAQGTGKQWNTSQISSEGLVITEFSRYDPEVFFCDLTIQSGRSDAEVDSKHCQGTNYHLCLVIWTHLGMVQYDG